MWLLATKVNSNYLGLLKEVQSFVEQALVCSLKYFSDVD